ncbi:hypothetical protein EMCRGX_G029978 [Ephydatia muelleri]
MLQHSFLFALALCSLQLKVGADLFCYTETQNCRPGSITVLRQEISTAAKQCCVGNSGVSYRISNSEGCTNCVVYGFFANLSDGKLLSNATIGEGSQNGLTVYFGLLKGLPPSIRKVQFKTDTPNQGQEKGSPKCTVSASWPYLTPQLMKFQVIMSASSNNLALEVNNTVRINPQLSSTGENEFVVPLSVSILDTNVMTVNFSSGAYYMPNESSIVTVTIVRGSVAPAKPLTFNLNCLALDETQQVTDNSLGSITVLYPTNKATIDVPINASCYNFTSAGFAVRLELDDKSQAYSIDLKGRNLTYVYFNKSIVVGFTVSEMNVTAKHSIEICVNVIHPLPGMEPITMTISSAPRSDNKSMVTLSESSDNKSMVTLSESRPVSCIQRRDTPHAGLVIYSLSSKDTRQPLDIFPDMLTVTVTGKDNEEGNEDDD